MKKIRLEIDALRVESFVTHAAAPGRGTVDGHMPIRHLDPATGDCGGSGGGSGDIYCISAYPCVPSDEPSCAGTCDVSCNGTCAPVGQMCA